MTTIETLTDEQIQELQDELAQRNNDDDRELRLACDFLLGVPTFSGAMTGLKARDLVVDAINDREEDAAVQAKGEAEERDAKGGE